jgi:hypothetical protein
MSWKKGAAAGEVGAMSEQAMQQLHETMYNQVSMAAQPVAHLEAEWTADTITNRIVKFMYKAASGSDLVQMPWHEMVSQLVQRAMHGFSVSCDKAAWFFAIDLSQAFFTAAMDLLVGTGKVNEIPANEAVRHVVLMEYEDKLDRILLDRAMWETTESIFSDEKARTKVYNALSKAYPRALDQILNVIVTEDDPNIRLTPEQQLKRVEEFLWHWIDDSMCRAWVSIEGAESVLTNENVGQLFQTLIAPFGVEDPYTCMPQAVTGQIGRPPPDWVFVETAVTRLFGQWTGGGDGFRPAKKRRKTGGGGGSWSGYGEDGEQDEVPAASTSGKNSAKGRPRAKVWAEKKVKQDLGSPGGDGAKGPGHPRCTSEEDCIGAPEDQLVQHIFNGKPGDIYCVVCWESFSSRNPTLEGELVED